jgi:ATP-binding cassette subfamily G (WHITE) protein 1/ATP-binding cassette subfamily G (WHITE) protein 2
MLLIQAGHVHGPVTISGTITVNGEAVTPEKMRQISGYVHQEDVVLDTMTVGEVLNFAAALRLPSNMSAEQKAQRAAAVADMLNLTKAWNSFFGSSMIKVT